MKKIEWANKELPGLPHEKLEKLNHKRLTDLENFKQSLTPEVMEKKIKSFKKRDYKAMTKKRLANMDKDKQQAGNIKKKVPVNAYKVLESKFIRVEGKKKKIITKEEFIGSYESMHEAGLAFGCGTTIVGNILHPDFKCIAWKGYTFKKKELDTKE